MQRLLIFDESEHAAAGIARALSLRNPAISVAVVDSLTRALDLVTAGTFDALVLGVTAPSSTISVLVDAAVEHSIPVVGIGRDESEVSYQRIEMANPSSLADQILAVLRWPRSQTPDFEVIHRIGFADCMRLEEVRWPGTAAPVLRVDLGEVESSRVSESSMVVAKRASVIRGPGVPETIEVFWEDPRPHLFQVLPSGRALCEARPGPESRRAPLAADAVCAIARGMAEGLATHHGAGFSAGPLREESTWLSLSGDVLLLGGGLRQTSVDSWRPYDGGFTWRPPEEFTAQCGFEIPGDSFRLGTFMMQLLGWEDPFRRRGPFVQTLSEYLQAEWTLDLSQHRVRNGALVDVLQTLMQPRAVDRPRGALLVEVLDRVAPKDWKGIIRRLAVGPRVAWQLHDTSPD